MWTDGFAHTHYETVFRHSTGKESVMSESQVVLQEQSAKPEHEGEAFSAFPITKSVQDRAWEAKQRRLKAEGKIPFGKKSN
jgi:hypothetical protein